MSSLFHRFTPSVIDAEPGQPLRVVLKPMGKIKALGHNFVLLKKATESKPFVDKAANATEKTDGAPGGGGRTTGSRAAGAEAASELMMLGTWD